MSGAYICQIIDVWHFLKSLENCGIWQSGLLSIYCTGGSGRILRYWTICYQARLANRWPRWGEKIAWKIRHGKKGEKERGPTAKTEVLTYRTPTRLFVLVSGQKPTSPQFQRRPFFLSCFIYVDCWTDVLHLSPTCPSWAWEGGVGHCSLLSSVQSHEWLTNWCSTGFSSRCHSVIASVLGLVGPVGLEVNASLI